MTKTALQFTDCIAADVPNSQAGCWVRIWSNTSTAHTSSFSYGAHIDGCAGVKASLDLLRIAFSGSINQLRRVHPAKTEARRQRKAGCTSLIATSSVESSHLFLQAGLTLGAVSSGRFDSSPTVLRPFWLHPIFLRAAKRRGCKARIISVQIAFLTELLSRAITNRNDKAQRHE